MSLISQQLRAVVVARADDRCEYCHVPQQGQVGRLPIDHVRPCSSGGRTELGNLALACPHCNALKWARVEWPDPHTGELVSLFNPRAQVWSDHFEWSDSHRFTLLGKTGCGRATIACLQINDPEMLAVRALLAELGLLAGGPQ